MPARVTVPERTSVTKLFCIPLGCQVYQKAPTEWQSYFSSGSRKKIILRPYFQCTSMVLSDVAVYLPIGNSKIC